jgi:acyl-CoA reductase-like NAD-dependent aldehyde dehydrogenase
MEDEIFGPLLPILTYKDIDAAILEVKKRQNLFPASSSAVSRRLSIISSQACPLAAEQSIR